jgi:hypothetical protein
MPPAPTMPPAAMPPAPDTLPELLAVFHNSNPDDHRRLVPEAGPEVSRANPTCATTTAGPTSPRVPLGRSSTQTRASSSTGGACEGGAREGETEGPNFKEQAQTLCPEAAGAEGKRDKIWGCGLGIRRKSAGRCLALQGSPHSCQHPSNLHKC